MEYYHGNFHHRGIYPLLMWAPDNLREWPQLLVNNVTNKTQGKGTIREVILSFNYDECCVRTHM